MFNIGQFSQLVKVSPRMLRYYEKSGIFYPAEIDKVNGYRLYSAMQIPLILRIVALRDMGFTIEEISSILDGFEEGDIIKIALEKKRNETENEIADMLKRIEILKTTMEKINDGNYTTSCQEVVIKSVTGLSVLSMKETVSDYSMQEELWSKLFSFIEENNLYDKLSDTTVAIYHDLIQKDKDFEIEVAVEIKEKYELEADVCYREIGPIDLAASVMCEGPYERVLPEGELLLAKWIEDNNYIIVGSERVYAYKHPYNEQDPNSFQTEIIFPIKEKEKR